MRKLVISLFCAALMMNAAFAKENSNDDKKPYKIWGGMMTFPLVVTYDGPVLPRESTAILVIAKDLYFYRLYRSHQVPQHIPYDLSEVYNQCRLGGFDLVPDIINYFFSRAFPFFL